MIDVVARIYVYMLAGQTMGAVVPASDRGRWNYLTAIFANKRLVDMCKMARHSPPAFLGNHLPWVVILSHQIEVEGRKFIAGNVRIKSA